MPGIAGILAPVALPEHEPLVRRMVATLRHQPQSAEAVVAVPELGVCAGWVAHGGSYAARQSGATADASVALLFAGECFGARQDAGDSLLERYRDEGPAFVGRLNGLFAGLVVDRARRQALLFNDRYGIERLHVFEQDGTLYFASEAKALLAVLPELRRFDETGVAQFLAFGSTIGGRTLFDGIRLAPGGSLWTFHPGQPVRRGRHFEPAVWEALPTLSEEDFDARLADALRRRVPAYLAGGQPVGLSLTGGLDTRMIVAGLPPGAMPALAYTYAAEGSDALLDLRIAREVAARRELPHHALRVGAEFLATFPRQLDRTVYVTDGCAGVMGTHELYLSEQARLLAPVRLTGNFGSEVLRSMSTFKRCGPDDELLDPALAARVGEAAAEQRERQVHPVTHAAFEEVPWHLAGLPIASRSQLTVRTPYMDDEIVELAYRAPAGRRCTAAPAISFIGRQDAALAALPTDRGLSLGANGMAARLRRAACDVTFKLDYWHKQGLPDALSGIDAAVGSLSHLGLLGLHKFLAYRVWFRRELAPYAAEVIGDARTRRLGFWSLPALQRVAADHASGRRNRLRDIHAVLTLEAVQRMLLDPAAHAPQAFSSHR